MAFYAVYELIDFKQLLRDLGDFTVTTFGASQTTVSLNADPTLSAVFRGDMAYDPATGELTGTVDRAEIYRDGDLVAEFGFADRENDVPVPLNGKSNTFLATWKSVDGFWAAWSFASENTINGSSGDDGQLFARGTIFAKAGNDGIILMESGDSSSPEDPSENNARDRAYGGKGDDYIVLLTDDALGVGGAGNDILQGSAGRAVMEGGKGADLFIFYNQGLDSVRDSYVGDETGLRAGIRDFRSGEDFLYFAPPIPPINGSAANGPAVAPSYITPINTDATSLEDLFGPGTLADLADFTLEGLDWRLSENAAGHAVIQRSGETEFGVTIDERVQIRDHGLAEIDLADILVGDDVFDL
ncbi:MAG: hypothetical protein AAGD12_10130 [Pseudomonadota bacterium]